MIALGRAVEAASGMPLSEYLQKAVFGPLGMKETTYDPDPARCAPTTPGIRGVVHDPLARAYMTRERRAGNAGLFSTADDLARFLRALLSGEVVRPETVRLMLSPVPGVSRDTRGLGWDVFDERPWAPGVGHTGFTGTLVWMDPAKARYLVLLTNRTYEGEEVNVRRLRTTVLAEVNR
jgi:CubicO group peptidase (beta-lactamase class C family)